MDAAGNIGKAKKVTVKILDVTAPDKVEGLGAAIRGTTYKSTLTWNAAADNVGISSYLVSVDGGKAKKVSGKTLSLVSGKLSVGVHTFTVAALDKAGNVSSASDLFSLKCWM